MLYNLIIKGNYKRGSSVTIAIGNNESTTEGMYIIAKQCMDEYIPHFLFEDYPESLKKVAEDEAKAAAKAAKKQQVILLLVLHYSTTLNNK